MVLDKEWVWITALLVLAAALRQTALWRKASQRQARFKLDQRRKAGIPDKDKRPFAEAADAAMRLRQEQKQRSIQAAATAAASAPAKGAGALRISRSSFAQSATGPTRSPFASFARPRPSSVASSFTLQDSDVHLPADPYRPISSTSSHRLPPGLAPASAPQPRFDSAYHQSINRFDSPEALPGAAKRPDVYSPPQSTLKRPQPAQSEAASDNEEADSSTARHGVSSRKIRKLTNGTQNAPRVAKRGPLDSLDTGGREKKSRQDGGDDEYYEDEDEEMEYVNLHAFKRKRRDDVESEASSCAGSSMLDDDDVREKPPDRASRHASSKRGKVAHQQDYDDVDIHQEEEEETASEDMSDEIMSADEASVSTHQRSTTRQRRTSSSKRKADTSEDREPGEEWVDLNGMHWKMGYDGVLRRLAIVFQMRPKYNMPKDSTHPDAALQVADYVGRFVSEEEYERLKAQKLLSFQELEREQERKDRENEDRRLAEEERLKGAEEEREIKSSPKRFRNTDLLFSSPQFGTPLRASAEPSTRGGLGSSIFSHPRSSFGRASASASPASFGGRLSLRASSRGSSPAPRTERVGSLESSERAPRRSTPLKRSSTSLDAEAKRRREEALLGRLREEARKKREAEEGAGSTRGSKASATANAQAQGTQTDSHSVSFVAPTSTKALAPLGEIRSVRFEAPAASSNAATTAPSESKTDVPSFFGSSVSKPINDSATQKGFSFAPAPSEAPKDASAAPSKTTAPIPAVSFLAPPTEPKSTASESKEPDFFSSANKSNSTATAHSSKALFGSGAATPTLQNASPSASGGFSFSKPTQSAGATSTPTGASQGLSFGAPLSVPSMSNNNVNSFSAAQAAPGSFSFSTPSTSSAPDMAKAGLPPKPALSFGATSQSSASTSAAAAPAAPFSFGGPSAPKSTAAPASATAQAGAFNFGALSKSTAATPPSAAGQTGATAPGFNFNFGAPGAGTGALKPVASTPSFSFTAPSQGGAAPGGAPAPFVFGAAAGASAAPGAFTFGKN